VLKTVFVDSLPDLTAIIHTSLLCVLIEKDFLTGDDGQTPTPPPQNHQEPLKRAKTHPNLITETLSSSV
jgi:hypothetical protein